jgi:hypothetical protein
MFFSNLFPNMLAKYARQICSPNMLDRASNFCGSDQVEGKLLHGETYGMPMAISIRLGSIVASRQPQRNEQG